MTQPTHAPSPHLFTASALCGATGPRDTNDVEVSCGSCRALLLAGELA